MYANGINRYEWKILQDQYSDYALKILGNYSDITFDKVMRSVEYLEKRTNHTLETIKCTASSMMTIGIQIPAYSNIDLLNADTATEFSNYELGTCKSYQKASNYFLSRESEIFRLIESGYKVANENTFNHLDHLRKIQLN
ncbi:MAG: hypothetical protein JKY48_04395 [Flavobacteriales bacterium]|nr:hypothetical protein [Flavobacteriales bacterium]